MFLNSSDTIMHSFCFVVLNTCSPIFFSQMGSSILPSSAYLFHDLIKWIFVPLQMFYSLSMPSNCLANNSGVAFKNTLPFRSSAGISPNWSRHKSNQSHSLLWSTLSTIFITWGFRLEKKFFPELIVIIFFALLIQFIFPDQNFMFPIMNI